MGGSPKPPPPPPDHSGKRAKFASRQSAARQQQADRYNAAVTNFNEQLGGFSGQIGDLGARVSGLGLADYGSLGDYEAEIGDLSRSLRSLQLNETKPQFDSMVHSPWGAVSVNVPGLQSANTNERDSALMELEDLQRSLGGIRQDFRAEEQNINNSMSDMYGQLIGLNSQLGNLGIGNENMLNTLRAQGDTMRGQIGAFNSPIADFTEADDRWLARIDPLFSQMDARLADITQRRDAERGRIDSFANQIYGDLSGLGDTLGDLTIADESGIRSAQRQLRDLQRQKAGFSSALDFDFNRERALATDLNAQIQELMQDRQDEMARVEQARRGFMDTAQFLNSQARMGNVYDGNLIQGLMDDIGMLRDEKAGFSSALDPTFTNTGRVLDSAEQRLAQLMTQRGEHLGRFEEQLGNLASDFEGIDPMNEMALNQTLSRAQSLASQLGRFSGQDVMGLDFQVQDQINAIDTSLQDLMMQRQQLQQQAVQMLNQVKEAQYLNMDGVTEAKDQAAAMREQAQLMNAQQALKEIDRVMQHLAGEKQRLSVDAQNVANAQSLAQRDLMNQIGPGGVPQFSNTPMIEGMTPEQYLALLQRAQQDDQQSQSAPALTSTFSASLGI